MVQIDTPNTCVCITTFKIKSYYILFSIIIYIFTKKHKTKLNKQTVLQLFFLNWNDNVDDKDTSNIMNSNSNNIDNCNINCINNNNNNTIINFLLQLPEKIQVFVYNCYGKGIVCNIINDVELQLMNDILINNGIFNEKITSIDEKNLTSIINFKAVKTDGRYLLMDKSTTITTTTKISEAVAAAETRKTTNENQLINLYNQLIYEQTTPLNTHQINKQDLGILILMLNFAKYQSRNQYDLFMNEFKCIDELVHLESFLLKKKLMLPKDLAIHAVYGIKANELNFINEQVITLQEFLKLLNTVFTSNKVTPESFIYHIKKFHIKIIESFYVLTNTRDIKKVKECMALMKI